MSLTVAAATAQAMGAALAADIGASPIIRIYSGSKPATPETTATGTLLATVTITGSFTSSGGVLTAADPGQVTPAASGTAGWFRILNSGGTTAKLDGTVGTSGADMNLSSTAISTASPLDLGVPTINVPVA